MVWSCTGAYDKQAFAEVEAVYTAKGEPFGFVLMYGYRDGRSFTEYFHSESKAMESGHNFVMGCDWMDAPETIRAQYYSVEDFIANNRK